MSLCKKVVLVSSLSLVLAACGGGSSSPSSPNRATSQQPDLIAVNRIDESTGYLVAFNGSNTTQVSNANGVELDPSSGIVTRKGVVYTTGSMKADKVTKWTYNGTTFVKGGEFTTGEGARASNIMFVSDTKAYVTTLFTPELIIFNPTTMEKTGSIDLSPYALGKDTDKNPNASDGVIRDGKLFLGLAQIDTLETFKCQAGASVLIIDVATDKVEKHIQDDRACLSGSLEPGNNIIMDEIGDIYVNNMGSYGYYPGLVAGYLRIKAGAEEFDPDYFFSITDLDVSGQVSGDKVSYMYRPIHVGNAVVYGNLWVPALSSNPPNFVKDKNYMAYKLDLRNKTATLIDVPATIGWSASTLQYKNKLIFGRATDSGTGFFGYDPASGTFKGDEKPVITTQGAPVKIELFQP